MTDLYSAQKHSKGGDETRLGRQLLQAAALAAIVTGMGVGGAMLRRDRKVSDAAFSPDRTRVAVAGEGLRHPLKRCRRAHD